MRPKHTCLLYTSHEEQETYITSFIQKGLRNNEKVIYIQEGHQRAGFLQDLYNRSKVEPILQKGHMKLVTYNELDIGGGVLDPQQMIEYISAETLGALSEKYAGLRIITDMTAFHGLTDIESLIRYEVELNRLLPNNCIGLCQYDKRSFTKTHLFDLIPLHPVIISNGKTLYNFPYHTSSDLLTSLIFENFSPNDLSS